MNGRRNSGNSRSLFFLLFIIIKFNEILNIYAISSDFLEWKTIWNKFAFASLTFPMCVCVAIFYFSFSSFRRRCLTIWLKLSLAACFFCFPFIYCTPHLKQITILSAWIASYQRNVIHDSCNNIRLWLYHKSQRWIDSNFRQITKTVAINNEWKSVFFSWEIVDDAIANTWNSSMLKHPSKHNRNLCKRNYFIYLFS